MQWGSAMSTVDVDEDFPFNEDFPNACFIAFTQRTGTGPAEIFPVSNITSTNFTVNRVNDIQGSHAFDWFAIGY